MKTPIIIALSIVGVLGTAGAAMAVNAGTLAGVNSSNIGNAPSLLVNSPTPGATDGSTPTPTPTSTLEPGDDGPHTGGSDDGAGHDAGDDNGGTTSGSNDGAGDDHGGDSGSGGSGSHDSSGGNGSGHSDDD